MTTIIVITYIYAYYNGQNMPIPRSYSTYTRSAGLLLGQLIKLGRKQKKWSAAELAERAGISRATLQKIEKGDLKCEIGLVFEVASLVDIPLLQADQPTLLEKLELVQTKIAILPQSIRKKRQEVDDDF